MTAKNKRGVYSKASRVTTAKPFPVAFRRLVIGSYALRRGALLLATTALLGATGRALAAEDVAHISAFELGPFTLHIALKPCRWSSYHGRDLVLSQRARRASSSLEFLAAGGWQAVGDARGVRREGSERARVEGVAASGAPVEITWSREMESDVATLVYAVSGPPATAWREDLIAPAGAVFFPPLPRGRATAAPVFVLSSRGIALFLETPATIFRPDPDAIRLEVRAPALRYRLLAGTPEEVLRAAARLRARAPAADASSSPPPLPVKDWRSLEAAVEAVLGTAVTERPFPTLVPAGDAVDPDLARRTLTVAAFLLGSLEGFDAVGEKEAGRLRTLHTVLAPVRESAAKAEDGIGAVRPLLVQYPSEEEAWKVTDQWLLGRDLLVAPVLGPKKTAREVYVPPGEWLELSSSNARRFRGPRRVTIDGISGGVAVLAREEATESFAVLRRLLVE